MKNLNILIIKIIEALKVFHHISKNLRKNSIYHIEQYKVYKYTKNLYNTLLHEIKDKKKSRKLVWLNHILNYSILGTPIVNFNKEIFDFRSLDLNAILEFYSQLNLEEQLVFEFFLKEYLKFLNLNISKEIINFEPTFNDIISTNNTRFYLRNWKNFDPTDHNISAHLFKIKKNFNFLNKQKEKEFSFEDFNQLISIQERYHFLNSMKSFKSFSANEIDFLRLKETDFNNLTLKEQHILQTYNDNIFSFQLKLKPILTEHFDSIKKAIDLFILDNKNNLNNTTLIENLFMNNSLLLDKIAYLLLQNKETYLILLSNLSNENKIKIKALDSYFISQNKTYYLDKLIQNVFNEKNTTTKIILDDSKNLLTNILNSFEFTLNKLFYMLSINPKESFSLNKDFLNFIGTPWFDAYWNDIQTNEIFKTNLTKDKIYQFIPFTKKNSKGMLVYWEDIWIDTISFCQYLHIMRGEQHLIREREFIIKKSFEYFNQYENLEITKRFVKWMDNKEIQKYHHYIDFFDNIWNEYVLFNKNKQNFQINWDLTFTHKVTVFDEISYYIYKYIWTYLDLLDITIALLFTRTWGLGFDMYLDPLLFFISYFLILYLYRRLITITFFHLLIEKKELSLSRKFSRYILQLEERALKLMTLRMDDYYYLGDKHKENFLFFVYAMFFFKIFLINIKYLNNKYWQNIFDTGLIQKKFLHTNPDITFVFEEHNKHFFYNKLEKIVLKYKAKLKKNYILYEYSLIEYKTALKSFILKKDFLSIGFFTKKQYTIQMEFNVLKLYIFSFIEILKTLTGHFSETARLVILEFFLFNFNSSHYYIFYVLTFPVRIFFLFEMLITYVFQFFKTSYEHFFSLSLKFIYDFIILKLQTFINIFLKSLNNLFNFFYFNIKNSIFNLFYFCQHIIDYIFFIFFNLKTWFIIIWYYAILPLISNIFFYKDFYVIYYQIINFLALNYICIKYLYLKFIYVFLFFLKKSYVFLNSISKYQIYYNFYHYYYEWLLYLKQKCILFLKKKNSLKGNDYDIILGISNISLSKSHNKNFLILFYSIWMDFKIEFENNIFNFIIKNVLYMLYFNMYNFFNSMQNFIFFILKEEFLIYKEFFNLYSYKYLNLFFIIKYSNFYIFLKQINLNKMLFFLEENSRLNYIWLWNNNLYILYFLTSLYKNLNPFFFINVFFNFINNNFLFKILTMWNLFCTAIKSYFNNLIDVICYPFIISNIFWNPIFSNIKNICLYSISLWVLQIQNYFFQFNLFYLETLKFLTILRIIIMHDFEFRFFNSTKFNNNLYIQNNINILNILEENKKKFFYYDQIIKLINLEEYSAAVFIKKKLNKKFKRKKHFFTREILVEHHINPQEKILTNSNLESKLERNIDLEYLYKQRYTQEFLLNIVRKEDDLIHKTHLLNTYEYPSVKDLKFKTWYKLKDYVIEIPFFNIFSFIKIQFYLIYNFIQDSFITIIFFPYWMSFSYILNFDIRFFSFLKKIIQKFNFTFNYVFYEYIKNIIFNFNKSIFISIKNFNFKILHDIFIYRIFLISPYYWKNIYHKNNSNNLLNDILIKQKFNIWYRKDNFLINLYTSLWDAFYIKNLIINNKNTHKYFFIQLFIEFKNDFFNSYWKYLDTIFSENYPLLFKKYLTYSLRNDELIFAFYLRLIYSIKFISLFIVESNIYIISHFFKNVCLFLYNFLTTPLRLFESYFNLFELYNIYSIKLKIDLNISYLLFKNQFKNIINYDFFYNLYLNYFIFNIQIFLNWYIIPLNKIYNIDLYKIDFSKNWIFFIKKYFNEFFIFNYVNLFKELYNLTKSGYFVLKNLIYKQLNAYIILNNIDIFFNNIKNLCFIYYHVSISLYKYRANYLFNLILNMDIKSFIFIPFKLIISIFYWFITDLWYCLQNIINYFFILENLIYVYFKKLIYFFVESLIHILYYVFFFIYEFNTIFIEFLLNIFCNYVFFFLQFFNNIAFKVLLIDYFYNWFQHYAHLINNFIYFIYECFYFLKDFDISVFIIYCHLYFNKIWLLFFTNYWWHYYINMYIYTFSQPLIQWLKYNFKPAWHKIYVWGDFFKNFPFKLSKINNVDLIQKNEIITQVYLLTLKDKLYVRKTVKLWKIWYQIHSYTNYLNNLNLPNIIKESMYKLYIIDIYKKNVSLLNSSFKKFVNNRAHLRNLYPNKEFTLTNNLNKFFYSIINTTKNDFQLKYTFDFRNFKNYYNKTIQLTQVETILNQKPKFYHVYKGRSHAQLKFNYENHIIRNNKGKFVFSNNLPKPYFMNSHTRKPFINVQDYLLWVDNTTNVLHKNPNWGFSWFFQNRVLNNFKKYHSIYKPFQYDKRDLDVKDYMFKEHLTYRVYPEDLSNVDYNDQIIEPSNFFKETSAIDYFLILSEILRVYEFMAFNQKIYNFYLDMFGREFAKLYYHFPGQSLYFKEDSLTVAQHVGILKKLLSENKFITLSPTSLINTLYDNDFLTFNKSLEALNTLNEYYYKGWFKQNYDSYSFMQQTEYGYNLDSIKTSSHNILKKSYDNMMEDFYIFLTDYVEDREFDFNYRNKDLINNSRVDETDFLNYNKSLYFDKTIHKLLVYRKFYDPFTTRDIFTNKYIASDLNYLNEDRYFESWSEFSKKNFNFVASTKFPFDFMYNFWHDNVLFGVNLKHAFNFNFKVPGFYLNHDFKFDYDDLKSNVTNFPLTLKMFSFSQWHKNFLENPLIKQYFMGSIWDYNADGFNQNFYNTPYFHSLMKEPFFKYYEGLSQQTEIGLIPFRQELTFENDTLFNNKVPLALEDEVWYDEFLNNHLFSYYTFSKNTIIDTLDLLNKDFINKPNINENDLYLKMSYLSTFENFLVYNPINYYNYPRKKLFTLFKKNQKKFLYNTFSERNYRSKSVIEWSESIRKIIPFEQNPLFRINMNRFRWNFYTAGEHLHKHLIWNLQHPFFYYNDLSGAFIEHAAQSPSPLTYAYDEAQNAEHKLNYYIYTFLHKKVMQNEFKHFNAKLFEKNWLEMIKEKKLPKMAKKDKDLFLSQLKFLLKKRKEFFEEKDKYIYFDEYFFTFFKILNNKFHKNKSIVTNNDHFNFIFDIQKFLTTEKKALNLKVYEYFSYFNYTMQTRAFKNLNIKNLNDFFISAANKVHITQEFNTLSFENMLLFVRHAFLFKVISPIQKLFNKLNEISIKRNEWRIDDNYNMSLRNLRFKIRHNIIDIYLIDFLTNQLTPMFKRPIRFSKTFLERKFARNFYLRNKFNVVFNDDISLNTRKDFRKGPTDFALHFVLKMNTNYFQYHSMLIPSPYVNSIDYYYYMSTKMINKPHCYKFWVFYEDLENVLNSPFLTQALNFNPYKFFCDTPEEFQFGFQDPASPIMEGIIDLHHDLVFFLILISVSILIVIINLVYFNLSKKWIRFINFKYNKWNYHIPNIISILNLPFLLISYITKKNSYTIKNIPFFSKWLSTQNGIDSWYSNYFLNGNWILQNLKTFNQKTIFSFKIINLFVLNLINFKENLNLLKILVLIRKIQWEISKNVIPSTKIEHDFKLLASGVHDQTESFAFITPENENKKIQIENASNKENIWFPNLFSHHTLVEVIWTLIPAFILILIALPSFSLLFSMDQIWQPSFTIKVIGNQWYWSYEYC